MPVQKAALAAMEKLQRTNDNQKATIDRFLAAIRYASQYLDRDRMAEVRRIMREGENAKG